MKKKRKGHLPNWAKPIFWGNGRLEVIIWLNLFAGLLLISCAVFGGWGLLSANDFRLFYAIPLIFLLVLGFYFFIASALLIFQGYAEDEE